MIQEQEIELQITVTIGGKKLEIRVPRNAELAEFVQSFLVKHQINPKYQAAIIRMVQQKLEETERMNKPDKSKEASVKEQSQHTEQLISQSGSKEQRESLGVNQAVKGNAKKLLLDKIRQQIELSESGVPQSRKVYQQWKMLEKEKTKKQNSALKSNQISQVNIARPSLSPDHFYRKGLEFKRVCLQNQEKQFKKIYPFKLNDRETTEADQEKLCNRLHKQRKDVRVRGVLSQIGEFESHKNKVSYDQVKKKVKDYDDQLDKMLYCMIRQGELTYARYRPKSRSPFRKTVLQ